MASPFGTDATTGRRLRFEQGPFIGKRALVVTTLGDRPHAIGPRGKSGELQELLFGLLHGTFAYTGMSVLPPWALPSADRLTDYAAARDDLLRRLDRLFSEAPIPFRPQFTGDYTPEWELAPHVRPGEHGVRIHTESAAMPGEHTSAREGAPSQVRDSDSSSHRSSSCATSSSASRNSSVWRCSPA